MSDVVWVALLSGAGSTLVVQLIGWLRNRHKDDADAELVSAEAGLTIDQRWEKYTAALEGRVKALEGRMETLEDELEREQNRSKGLEAEVDRYRSIARSLLRHVLKLRDALAKAHAEVPEIPPDIEDALTGIDLP
jgi:predicted  nucleic acid-binding Zn-ribbon protein